VNTRRPLTLGDCARIPDGRVGLVRERLGKMIGVRVRRTTSATDQFVLFRTTDLARVQCSAGRMSPAGCVRYLRATLAKMQQRQRRRGR
jgi:hypothetical protein